MCNLFAHSENVPASNCALSIYMANSDPLCKGLVFSIFRSALHHSCHSVISDTTTHDHLQFCRSLTVIDMRHLGDPKEVHGIAVEEANQQRHVGRPRPGLSPQ